MPAHNEASRIVDTIRAIRQVEVIDEVIVIDDGSSDETGSVARTAGATLIALPANRGKGEALEAGMAAAGSADVVALVDADLGRSASQVTALLEPVIAGEVDMAIASFPRPAAKAGFGFVQGLARWGVRRFGGPFDARSPLSGQRVLNRTALEACRPFESGYGVEVALTIRALRAGLSIAEVPTTMTHAATRRDVAGFMHRGRQFMHVAAALVRVAREPYR
jgi:glycosyltransferase involved in cell wall biosynthesis